MTHPISPLCFVAQITCKDGSTLYTAYSTAAEASARVKLANSNDAEYGSYFYTCMNATEVGNLKYAAMIPSKRIVLVDKREA